MLVTVSFLPVAHVASCDHLCGVRRGCGLPFWMVVIDFVCSYCLSQQSFRRQEFRSLLPVSSEWCILIFHHSGLEDI
jgi:hypothetical protein